MRVLYISGIGPFGGSSRSLFEAIRAMPAGSIEACFVAARGTAVPYYACVSVDLVAAVGLTRFDNSAYSHYRGLRWLVVLRELWHFPFTIAALLRAKRRWPQVDVIHANEIMDIVTLMMARRLFRAPVVLHVRSVARTGDGSARTRWLERRLRASVDAIIAIDETVRASLPADVAVDVIHNSFTPARDPVPDPRMAARLDALRPGSLKVGFIGNLHHAKGLFDLLEAARIVRDRGGDVEFLIVGGVTRPDRGLKAWALARLGLSQNVHAQATAQVARDGLGDIVHFLGPTNDIQCVYERLDVLCFPSHFNAAGRPVFEAAFSAVPSIVALDEPRPDTLIHGETGLAVPARDPECLAEAILRLADDRCAVARMGERARELAVRNFSPRTNARKILQVYERVARRWAERRHTSSGRR